MSAMPRRSLILFQRAELAAPSLRVTIIHLCHTQVPTAETHRTEEDGVTILIPGTE